MDLLIINIFVTEGKKLMLKVLLKLMLLLLLHFTLLLFLLLMFDLKIIRCRLISS